jgi:mono/diheme cytochrome c family protein
MTSRKLVLAILAIAILTLVPALLPDSEPTIRAASTFAPPEEAVENMIADYCLACHGDASRTAGLSLEAFDAGRPEAEAETAEKILRKLHTGMMPPSFAPQPEPETVKAFVEALEKRIDEEAAKNPNPGRRTFQRLNRAEYARSVEDLLGLEVDVEALLPPDTVSHSFDNIADVQGMSPTVMDSYLRAADKISREAVGDPEVEPSVATYKAPKTASQVRHVEGAPFGTRGGIAVVHNFPADGEYVFSIELHASPEGYLFGQTSEGEQIDVSIDGERVALVPVDPLMSEEDEAGMKLETDPILVKAGSHRVAAAFLQKGEGPIDDLMTPIEHTLADGEIGIDYGITTLPHLRDLSISGPHRVTGVSDTGSRRRIFRCRPTSSEEELPCAAQILKDLATRAYRRPVVDPDLEALMSFYAMGREERDFESGIRMALQAILSSPSFVFRLERMREEAAPGDSYPVSSLDLASRLSYFLWAGAPDEKLLALASEGKLSEPERFEGEVHRMLEDPRAEALATRFASQWLRLQDLEKLHPDAVLYPYYDATLAQAMKRETELFFYNLVREDRSVLELLTADYSFVNERLAKHYAVPNVNGSAFRRVALDGVNANRRGVLGHGSILTLTSVANRTSPVQRGKWVMEVLLGSPPPPPPPNVPDLEETNAVAQDRVLTIRERMEEHRKNPACTSCHTVIDPIGLALENFDVTGAYRTKDGGAPVDASGELYDGTPIDGPLGLRDALLKRSDAFLLSFTESLLTYALGRRVEYYDMPAVRKIVRDAAENDHRMSSYILGVVGSAPFRMSRTDGAPFPTTEVHGQE